MTRRRWYLVIGAFIAAALPTLSIPAAASTTPTVSCPAVAVLENAQHNGHNCSTISPSVSARWTRQLNGYPGVPLIAAGRVFVTASIHPSYGASLYALSQATGQILWGPVRVDGTYWSFPIAYDAGRVFVTDIDGTVRAFDARSGHLLWTTETQTSSGYPTATAGRVYVQSYGSVYALSEATGQIVWSSERLDGLDATVAVDTTGVYAPAGCGSTTKLGLAKGLRLWSGPNSCSGLYGGVGGLWGGRVYDLESHLILDKATGHEVGSSAGVAAFNGSQGYFGVGAYVFCEESSTQTPRWTRYLGERLIGAPVTTANGLVIVLTQANHLIGLDGATGRQMFIRTVPLASQTFHYDGLNTSISVGNGAVVAPNGEALTLFR